MRGWFRTEGGENMMCATYLGQWNSASSERIETKHDSFYSLERLVSKNELISFRFQQFALLYEKKEVGQVREKVPNFVDLP